MSEKEKESHKLGLSVGSSFQNTQELRKVLEQSISREEEVLTASQPVESDQNQEESQVNGEGVETEASTETLSRLSRSGHSRKEKLEARSRDQEDVEESLGRYATKRPVPLSLPIALSVLLGMVHVALPFINLVATNQQTQDLYAGWAISQGQVPYGHFFGVNGLLYYGISALGSLVGGQVLLVAFQILAYFFAGTSLYRMVRSLVASEKIAGQVQLLFYLLAGVLGFGGNYAVFYALPFLFGSMNFILAYLEGEKTDESFVAYGAGACLAFMIVPWLSVIFYLLAFLGLTAYHVKQKKLAHGFYQFLAALLGFSLVFYPLGYITVWNGSFGYAIHQTLYSLRSLQFDAGHLFANLVYYCLLLLTLGFASAFVMSFRKVSTSGQRMIRFVSCFGLLLVVAIVVGTPEQGAYQFLSLLPFGLPLLALWFAGDESTYQRRKMKNNSIWDLYFSSQAFLPILAMAYLVGYPVVNQFVLQNNLANERSTIAHYIKSHSDSKDTIYAWDQTAHLYQESGRLAASALLTPTAYLGPKENRTNLTNQIKQDKPKFIVVNKDLDVTSALQKVLTKNYEKVNQKGSQYTLYRYK